jgi:hypothetical protein
VFMHLCFSSVCVCVQNPTVDVLYGAAVVRGQGEVVRWGPGVQRSHDGIRVVRVLQPQGVAQLVDRHQEEVYTWRRGQTAGQRRCSPTRTSHLYLLTQGLVMVPRRRNAGGLTDPLRPCGPPLRSLRGPDVRLPKVFTLCRCDAAARAVIGPLTKTRRRTKTGTRLRRSVWVVIALC